ncbi:hypothetical protein N0V93_006036 [Gnomoniopsis smithogilvyi]|uniref:Rhodopsin domain-containing protein n=1 Tax=Gnomoniopsis smithogilvyi TaxID=1191159 RepID=A0A9W9CU49_9PEZI|nr:hypothetical protein N0V93_006036 [Gnomoniopsis smithogilvyi]
MAGDTTDADQYNGGDLLITLIVFQVLTWISVALRTYVRTMLTKNFQTDDWLMLVAQANFTLSCAFIALGLTVGLGHHNAVLPQKDEILAIKWQALATATYISNMMFIKLSIGVFLLRLATQRRYRYTIWGSMGVIASMSTALFLWDIFQCNPVAAQWDYTIPGYQCASTSQVVNVAYSLSVLSILSDWLYALLPIPMLWKATMTPQAKITVSVVLSLGIFASVATLIRVRFLADLTDVDDILYAGTNPMVWTLVEPGVAIVAASLVTIRPLLRQMRFSGFDSAERSRNRGFWGRYGRAAGGASKLEENKRNSRKSRAISGMDAFERSVIGLSDLEAGCGASERRMTFRESMALQSRDTTLISQDSIGDEGVGKKTAVRNFSTPLRVVAMREMGKEVGGDDDDTSPVSPLSPGFVVRSRAETPENVFGNGHEHEQEGTTLRGHVQYGKTVWRSETPSSPEEAVDIEKLRDVVLRTT